jgi:hypothetical protein
MDPAAALSSSADFPVSPVLRPTLLQRFLAGTRRAWLLQLLGMSLSPSCRFHPAEMNNRVGQCSTAHAAFALRLGARPSDLFTFEATTRSLLLRPGDFLFCAAQRPISLSARRLCAASAIRRRSRHDWRSTSLSARRRLRRSASITSMTGPFQLARHCVEAKMPE